MLGSNNNQNGRNNSYDPTYYSRISFKNESDKLRLGFSVWKGCLKLAVSELKAFDGSGGGRAEDLAYIHLSPTKALIMSEYVKEVISKPDSTQILGVNTGASDTNGLLAIAREADGQPYLIIAKIDKDGNFVQQQRFNFNFHYHYGLKIHDLKDLSFEKDFDDNAELTQLQQMLEDFARSSNGTYGASVWDIGRYEFNGKVIKPVSMIMEKLGIERKGNGGAGGRGYSNDGFFNNNSSGGGDKKTESGSTGYSSGSFDDLESEFE